MRRTAVSRWNRGHCLSVAECSPLQFGHRLKEAVQVFQPCSPPQLEHLSFLLQWFATWPYLLHLKHRTGLGMYGLTLNNMYPILTSAGNSVLEKWTNTVVGSCKVWVSRERYLKRFVKVTFCVFKLSWSFSGVRSRGTLYSTPFEPCGGSNVVDMDTDFLPSDQEFKESSVLICWAVLHLIMRSPLLNGMHDT